MRRHLTFPRVVCALLLGAAANVLVAWACVMWSPQVWKVNPYLLIETGQHLPIWPAPNGEMAYWFAEGGWGWCLSEPAGYPQATGHVVWHRYPWPRDEYRVAGWPLPALQSHVHTSGRNVASMPIKWQLPWRVIVWRGYNTSDLPAWLGAYPQRRLPLVPMPVGFAVNTLFCAVGVWGVAVVLRRWRRKRLGYPVCERCGYNLTGLVEPVRCPECGADHKP